MKQFQMREIREAYAHAAEGGQALHLHNCNMNGHDLFKRYPEIAHLFDQDKDRLIKTAKSLGVRVIKVEHEGTPRQHIDLCGCPMEKAKKLCEQSGLVSKPMKQIYTAGYSGHSPAQLKLAADNLGALVVDIRHKPFSRVPGWNLTELHTLMDGKSPARVAHLSALGNVAVGTGGVVLSNPALGVETVLRWAADRPLILLCGCAEFHSCHRYRVSQLLAGHGVQTQELTWPELPTPDLKAISLWQPWASLIAIGAKRVETRGWSTSYRGPLAIHAAKNTSQLDYCTLPSFLNALHGAGMWQIPDTITSTFSERSIVAAYHKLTIKQKLQWLPLPLGAVVAIVDLVDCVPTETLAPKLSLDETAFGNYTRGRFGWVLENVRKIEPVPYRGAQGFFTVERAVLGGDFA